MSLPPGFIDDLRNRVSLVDVAGRKVMWDRGKSNTTKRDMWAPCPFHQEDTPSFHVDGRKGFYYCFGCHAKGDLFKFVQETEKVSFMEAVKILAAEAGMEMPEPDPREKARADRRTELSEVTEAAVAHYRLQLRTGAAADARAYLERRGLSAETQARFEIGFAPNDRQGAFRALRDKGMPADMIVAAGIATRPDDGGAPYDGFRDRIMFPIRDPQGRCIGFGGRAMSADAWAKYLNTRATDLFDKGRALYNHGPAREAVAKGATLIVAEGYMDVIALSQAGFGGAVAPLGTAITEHQLAHLWRMADEPVIALDGDRAGLKAARDLIDLALPRLGPGKTLRFAMMPAGQDPDEVIRAGGAEAMTALIDRAEPMIDMLWRRETEGGVFDTPERRAGLETALQAAVAAIPDEGLKRYYRQDLRDRLWQFFRTTTRRDRKARPDGTAPRAETAGSPLAAGTLSETDLRTTLILATLAHHPRLIDRFEADLERLSPGDADQAAIARHLLWTEARDRESLLSGLNDANLTESLEKLMGLGHVRLQSWIRAEDTTPIAEQCLHGEFAKLAARRGIEHEWDEGREELSSPDVHPHLAWRINHAVQARHAAEGPAVPDGAGAGASDGPDYASQRKRFLDVIKGAGKKEKKG
ncbi:DNA primase [Rhodobacterales bacterium HKCCE2091]|nr:DNA primase [Rhodobacterales bacterium HKCCE2091]